MQGGYGRARGNRGSGDAGSASGRGVRLRMRRGRAGEPQDGTDSQEPPGPAVPGTDVEDEMRMLEEEEQMLINEIDELRQAIDLNKNKKKEVNR